MEHAVERRKNKRFNLRTDAVAFVRLPWSNFATAARIAEISMDGLTLFHMGSALLPYSRLELDIVLPGQIAYLQELPGRIIFDNKARNKTTRGFSLRRCGVRFYELTDDQKAYVRHLVEDCTGHN